MLSFSKDIPEMKEKNWTEIHISLSEVITIDLQVDLNQNFPCDSLYVLVISHPNVVLAHGRLDVINYV